MKEMLKKIQDVIKENLPEQTSKELRLYLEEMDEFKKENEDLRKKQNIFSDQIGDLKERNCQQAKIIREFKDIENDIKSKEKSLFLRQVNLDQKELEQKTDKIQKDEAEKRADVVFRLVDTLFRNNSFKKTVTENIPINQTIYKDEYDTNGNYKSVPDYDSIVHEESTKTIKIEND